MKRYKLRLLVALLTFCLGLFLVKAIHLLEHAISKRYYIVNDSISSITVPDPLDSNEIYNVILRETFVGPKGHLVVVDSESANVVNEIESLKTLGHEGPYSKFIQGSMPEAETETLDNFVAVNEVTGPVAISAPDLNMVMMSRDLSLENPDLFWTEFYRIYPSGSSAIFFSQVGFNSRHDQAFVYVGHSCGGDCGTGSHVLLVKTNGKWRIVRSEVLWIS